MNDERPQILIAVRQVCEVMTINQTCGAAISGSVPFTFNVITFNAVSKNFSVV